MQLDERDIKIMGALEKDARMSNKDLADHIALSPAACWERVKRLENNGFIVGYHAAIDDSQLLGFSKVILQVELNNHRQADFAKFEAHMLAENVVVRCTAVGGDIDYFVEVVANSVTEYQQTVDAWLEADIGIKKYYSFFVTKDIKRPQVMALKAGL